MRFNLLCLGSIFGASAVLGACAADATSPSATQPRSVTLSFAATGARSVTAASASSSAAGPSFAVLGSAADVLIITKAELVLARLELQRQGAVCSSTEAAGDDDRSDDSCAELELAPRLVSLPVDGSVANMLSVSVPSGTYSAFEAKIRPVVARRSASTAFLAAYPELAGVSVRVEGTFNGKAFTYVGAPIVELESAFDPPLVADQAGINITMKVDLTNWFRTAAGTLVDPATSNPGGTNAGLVSANITRSFSAFRDDDHDGQDDHGGDGSDNRGQNR